jgi:hypothetical protein
LRLTSDISNVASLNLFHFSMSNTEIYRKRSAFSLNECIQSENGSVKRSEINTLPASQRTCPVNDTISQSTSFTDLPNLKMLSSNWSTSSRSWNGDEGNRVDNIYPDQCGDSKGKSRQRSRETSPSCQYSPVGSERSGNQKLESASWNANTWSYDPDLIMLLYALGGWIGSGERGYVDARTLRWIVSTAETDNRTY